MRSKKNNFVSSISLLCFLFVLFFMFTFFANIKEAHASSLSTKNNKAHTVYLKKIKKLGKRGANYKFVDLTGDGVHEALVIYSENTGSGSNFEIYTYKNGKAIRNFSIGLYGPAKIYVYQKSKAVVCYGYGHGGEYYEYFKYKNGKYSYVAGKSRKALAGGGLENGSWNYYKRGISFKGFTKSAFLSKVKSLTLGKRKTYSTSGWKWAASN